MDMQHLAAGGRDVKSRDDRAGEARGAVRDELAGSPRRNVKVDERGVEDLAVEQVADYQVVRSAGERRRGIAGIAGVSPRAAAVIESAAPSVMSSSITSIRRRSRRG